MYFMVFDFRVRLWIEKYCELIEGFERECLFEMSDVELMGSMNDFQICYQEYIFIFVVRVEEFDVCFLFFVCLLFCLCV